jgi:hypothetical protein
MSKPIPIVLAIDVESDSRHAPPQGGVEVAGLMRTLDAFERLRPRFEDATGKAVRFAWFVRMDPQVAAQGGHANALVESAASAFDAIGAAGDVVGLHIHAGRWNAGDRRWLVDLADPEWIDECIVTSLEAYRSRFGRSCREHRFGDRFSSAAVFARLAELGVQVDLTVEPGQRAARPADHDGPPIGTVPGYADAPRAAHRAGDTALWILPLSSADPAPAYAPLPRWMRRIRYLGQPRHRTLLLDRAWPTPGLVWDLAEEQLEAGARHLAFVIRSDLIHRPEWIGTAAVLESLLTRELVHRLAFVGGEEAVARSVAG